MYVCTSVALVCTYVLFLPYVATVHMYVLYNGEGRGGGGGGKIPSTISG